MRSKPKIRRYTDCSKEIAAAEAQAAHWATKAQQYLDAGRKDKAEHLQIRSQFYLTRADRMRPQQVAAE